MFALPPSLNAGVLASGLVLSLASSGADAAGVFEQTTPPPGSEPSAPEGTTARVSEGRVLVRDFLKFIELISGQPLVVPTDAPELDPAIQLEVIGDIEHLTAPLAEALLALSGTAIVEEELADGRRVRKVIPTVAPRRGPPQSRALPVIARAEALEKRRPGEIAVLIEPLTHALPAEAATTLRELVADGERGAPTLSVVALDRERRLLLKGRVALLRHVHALLAVIDRAPHETRSSVEIVTLEHADAETVSDQLRQALEPLGTRRAARGETGDESAPRIVADPRTQKVIIRGRSARRVALARTLVALLDVSRRVDLGRTRIYAVRYLRAETLAETLRAWLEGSPLGERVRIVPHADTNSILIRAVGRDLATVEQRLRRLDVEGAALLGGSPDDGPIGDDPIVLRARTVAGDAHARARQLRERLGGELGARLRIVVPEATGTLLIGAPAKSWPKIDGALAEPLPPGRR